MVIIIDHSFCVRSKKCLNVEVCCYYADAELSYVIPISYNGLISVCEYEYFDLSHLKLDLPEAHS